MAIWDMKIFRLKYVVSGRRGLRGSREFIMSTSSTHYLMVFAPQPHDAGGGEYGMKFTVSRMRLKTKWKISTQDINSLQLEFKSRVKLSNIRLQSFIHGYRRKKKGRRREKNVLKTFFHPQRKSIKAMMKINGILHIILCCACVSSLKVK